MYKEREIKFVFPNKNGCGIYKISFANKYYIGCSNNIFKRIREHRRLINYLMEKEILVAMGAYRKIKKMLVSNSRIDIAICTILEECEEKFLIAVEREYLIKSVNDKNCLNESFPHGQIKMRSINKFLEERKAKMKDSWEKENKEMFAHLNLNVQ